MKTIFSIFFLLISIAVVNAQDMPEKKFWLGPTVGLNRTGWVGGKVFKHSSYETYNFFDDYPDTIKAFRYHIGYTAGIGNEFELNHKLRLFLEAQYTRSFVNSLGSSDTTWFDNFGDRADVGDQEFFAFNVGVLF